MILKNFLDVNKIDYDFIFKIKDEFKMLFVLISISEFFNFIKLIDEGHNKIKIIIIIIHNNLI